jgi:hypothetical protein
MRRFVTILTAVVAVAAFSTLSFAQATTAAKPATTVKPAVATQPAPAAKPVVAVQAAPKSVAKPLSANGKVTKFDEATKTLTVGVKEFVLAPDAKIMAGAKVATTADLDGKTVKVTYTVVDGKNVASKVTIAATPKVAAPKK